MPVGQTVERKGQMVISSTANKQVKYVNALMKNAKMRREEGLFVAEGLRICKEVPKGRLHTLYVSESFRKSPECLPLEEKADRVEIATDPVFSAMSGTQTPQGVLALVRQYAYTWEQVSRAKGGGNPPAHLMVLEHLQDPGNLGTVFRAGEGAGVTGILMDVGTADIYNPKAIRSTMGSVLRVPFLYVEDLPGALKQLRDKGVRLYASDLSAKRDYDQEGYQGDIGFLVGNEAGGLSSQAVSLAHAKIKVPMAGQVESLNAAVAASILMYEAARQRRAASRG